MNQNIVYSTSTEGFEPKSDEVLAVDRFPNDRPVYDDGRDLVYADGTIGIYHSYCCGGMGADPYTLTPDNLIPAWEWVATHFKR